MHIPLCAQNLIYLAYHHHPFAVHPPLVKETYAQFPAVVVSNGLCITQTILLPIWSVYLFGKTRCNIYYTHFAHRNLYICTNLISKFKLYALCYTYLHTRMNVVTYGICLCITMTLAMCMLLYSTVDLISGDGGGAKQLLSGG